MTVSASETHKLKEAPSVSGVLPIFHERWSPRAFADRGVAPETVAKLFEAARWAPSSNNEQPWRFIVGLRKTESWQEIFGSLGEFNQKWAAKAPVLMLGTALTKFSRNGTPNRFAVHDLGAAAGYLVLEAAALGLAAHQMAGFDENKARAALGIPADYAIGSVIALGYQGEPESLGDAELIKREVSPRERKPLREFVYSAWGVPMEMGS